MNSINNEEIERRAEALSNDPRMKQVVNRIQRLPLWFLGGAFTIPIMVHRYLPRNELTGGPKRLHLFGVGLFGGFLGLQIGIWKVKNFYWSVDPDGSLWQQAEDLVKDASSKPEYRNMNEKENKENFKEDEELFKDDLFSEINKKSN